MDARSWHEQCELGWSSYQGAHEQRAIVIIDSSRSWTLHWLATHRHMRQRFHREGSQQFILPSDSSYR